MKQLIFLIIFCVFSFDISAQSLGSNLSRVASNYAGIYLQPFVDAVGAGLNSGLLFSQNLNIGADKALHIGISFQSAGTILPSSERSFNASYIDTVMYNYQGQEYPVEGHATINNAPTIFGSREPGIADVEVNSRITIIGGIGYPVREHKVEKTIGGVYNSNFIPIVIPQVEIGNLFGTSIVLRAFPTVKLGDLGNLNFWGTGLRNNINSFISGLPVKINIGTYYQQLSLTDSTGHQISRFETTVFNINVNKRYSIFTIYGGLQFENSNLNVDYYYKDPNNKQYNFRINFNLTGKDSFRFIAGSSVNLGKFAVNLNLDAAKLYTVSLGFNYLIF